MATLSEAPSSSSSSENGSSGSGNGSGDSTGVVARNGDKTIGEFAGDDGICLHLTVSTGLERDAVQQLKTFVAALPELSALVKKVSAPRAGLVMLLAIPTVSDAADADGTISAINDITDLDGIDPESVAASTHASASPSVVVARMCRLLANLLCSTNMVEKAYAVVAQQLHQVSFQRMYMIRAQKRTITLSFFLEHIACTCPTKWQTISQANYLLSKNNMFSHITGMRARRCRKYGSRAGQCSPLRHCCGIEHCFAKCITCARHWECGRC